MASKAEYRDRCSCAQNKKGCIPKPYDLEREVPEIITKLTGIHIPDQYDSLVTVLVICNVMIAAIYGASFLFEKFKKASRDSFVAAQKNKK